MTKRHTLTDQEIDERKRNLARAREMFPAVFGDEVKPLVIGADRGLQQALGISAEAARHVLQWVTRRREYLQALAEPGSKRWHLDGTIGGEVSAEHRHQAHAELTAPKGDPKPKPTKQPEARGPHIMSATVHARSIKATVVLEADDIARLKVLPGTSRVALCVHVAGRSLTAELNAKSIRKCIAGIEAAGPAGANVVLQGRLEGGDRLVDAGIVAQAKTPKATVAA